jgi:uncharacterized protein YmfQ (DUF2313 family)
MSRRTGQDGHIELSGKWWVVRWWMDVPGQEKRRHMRERVCPISGSGSLSKSERQRRAREIVAASGADTEEYFQKVVKKKGGGITFREQRNNGSTISKIEDASLLRLQHWNRGRAVSTTGLTRTSQM